MATIHPTTPQSIATPPTSSGRPPAFAFPRDYYFPPFFTRQSQSTTFHAQCQKWSDLIQNYCRAHRMWKLSLVDVIDTDLFYNRPLGKRLAMADVREVVEFMRKDGRAEWAGRAGPGEERSVAWIWWRTPDEWSGAIAEWVSLRLVLVPSQLRGRWMSGVGDFWGRECVDFGLG